MAADAPLAKLLEAVRERLLVCGGEPISGDLAGLFDRGDVDTQVVSAQTLAMLKRLGGPRSLTRLWDMPLFHLCLRRGIVVDPEVEELIVSARHTLLNRVARESELDEADFRMLVTVACQCFNNEYLYPVVGDEESARSIIETRLRAMIADADPRPDDVMACAMCAPLWSLGLSPAILASDTLRTREGVGEVLVRQIQEHSEEDAIRSGIRSHELEIDAVTESVRAQYEQSPYPRWFAITLKKPRPFAHLVTNAIGNADSLGRGRPVDVLVAGCGTGREPISIASTYSDVSVVAIDVSRESLAYAIRQARRYGLSNIEFIHANLLRVGALKMQFDAVFASGVIHTLASPADGLRALASVVRPGGLLRIAVYSRRARAGLRPFQNLVGSQTSTDVSDLKVIRRQLLTKRSPGLDRLLQSRDFYYSSGFRDLLGPAHELQFTPKELKSLLESCHLRFRGFANLSAATRDGYRQCFPADPHMTDLDLLDQYEARHPDMFRSLQTFWCTPERPARTGAVPQ